MTNVVFPVNTVSMNRNRNFTGRDRELGRVRNVLGRRDDGNLLSNNQLEVQQDVNKKTGPACCVLEGPSGVGKTQIALEYTYRYRNDFDVIFWLTAEHDWTLISTYAQIADRLGLLDPTTFVNDGDEKQLLAVQKARQWLQSTERRWLLVFDDVEDFVDISPYLPLETLSHGSIILTKQKPDEFPAIKMAVSIPVKPFDRDDAAAFLSRFLDKDPADEKEKQSVRELSDTVNGLPLAIAIIGGHIMRSGSELVSYIERLDRYSNAWTGSAVGPVNQDEKNLATVFEIAMIRLTEEARSLIEIIAFLSPDHIPMALFVRAIETRTCTFLRTKAVLYGMVRELQERQLIRHETSGEEEYLTIHRKIQWNVIARLSRDHLRRWEVFRQAWRLVRDVLPKDAPFTLPSSHERLKLQKYGPHVLSLRAHCLWPDPPINFPVKFAQLLFNVRTHVWQDGRSISGVRVMDENNVREVLLLRANVYETYKIMSCLVGVSLRKQYMDQRVQLLSAQKLPYDAMPQSEVTRNDQIRQWIVYTDVAYGLVQQEDFKGAANIMRMLLNKNGEWGSEDSYPYQYAQYHQIIAVCLMAEGNPIEAIRSITCCTDLLTKLISAMHPMTQLMHFITGFLVWHAGKPTKALQINESVLTFRRAFLGEFSHSTLESYFTCARLLIEDGEYEKACTYFDKCLQRRKRAAWNEEGVARAQYHYSRVLARLGRTVEAYKQRAAAKKTRERFLEEYPEYLHKTDNDETVFDQMVSIWAGRFTGKMKQSTPFFAHRDRITAWLDDIDLAPASS